MNANSIISALIKRNYTGVWGSVDETGQSTIIKTVVTNLANAILMDEIPSALSDVIETISTTFSRKGSEAAWAAILDANRDVRSAIEEFLIADATDADIEEEKEPTPVVRDHTGAINRLGALMDNYATRQAFRIIRDSVATVPGEPLETPDTHLLQPDAASKPKLQAVEGVFPAAPDSLRIAFKDAAFFQILTLNARSMYSVDLVRFFDDGSPWVVEIRRSGGLYVGDFIEFGRRAARSYEGFMGGEDWEKVESIMSVRQLFVFIIPMLPAMGQKKFIGVWELDDLTPLLRDSRDSGDIASIGAVHALVDQREGDMYEHIRQMVFSIYVTSLVGVRRGGSDLRVGDTDAISSLTYADVDSNNNTQIDFRPPSTFVYTRMKRLTEKVTRPNGEVVEIPTNNFAEVVQAVSPQEAMMMKRQGFTKVIDLDLMRAQMPRARVYEAKNGSPVACALLWNYTFSGKTLTALGLDSRLAPIVHFSNNEQFMYSSFIQEAGFRIAPPTTPINQHRLNWVVDPANGESRWQLTANDNNRKFTLTAHRRYLSTALSRLTFESHDARLLVQAFVQAATSNVCGSGTGYIGMVNRILSQVKVSSELLRAAELKAPVVFDRWQQVSFADRKLSELATIPCNYMAYLSGPSVAEPPECNVWDFLKDWLEASRGPNEAALGPCLPSARLVNSEMEERLRDDVTDMYTNRIRFVYVSQNVTKGLYDFLNEASISTERPINVFSDSELSRVSNLGYAFGWNREGELTLVVGNERLCLELIDKFSIPFVLKFRNMEGEDRRSVLAGLFNKPTRLLKVVQADLIFRNHILKLGTLTNGANKLETYELNKVRPGEAKPMPEESSKVPLDVRQAVLRCAENEAQGTGGRTDFSKVAVRVIQSVSFALMWNLAALAKASHTRRRNRQHCSFFPINSESIYSVISDFDAHFKGAFDPESRGPVDIRPAWTKHCFNGHESIKAFAPSSADIKKRRARWDNNDYYVFRYSDNIYVIGKCGLWFSMDVSKSESGARHRDILNVVDFIVNTAGLSGGNPGMDAFREYIHECVITAASHPTVVLGGMGIQYNGFASGIPVTFEVNDVRSSAIVYWDTFISNFFTQEFCNKMPYIRSLLEKNRGIMTSDFELDDVSDSRSYLNLGVEILSERAKNLLLELGIRLKIEKVGVTYTKDDVLGAGVVSLPMNLDLLGSAAERYRDGSIVPYLDEARFTKSMMFAKDESVSSKTVLYGSRLGVVGNSIVGTVEHVPSSTFIKHLREGKIIVPISMAARIDALKAEWDSTYRDNKAQIRESRAVARAEKKPWRPEQHHFVDNFSAITLSGVLVDCCWEGVGMTTNDQFGLMINAAAYVYDILKYCGLGIVVPGKVAHTRAVIEFIRAAMSSLTQIPDDVLSKLGVGRVKQEGGSLVRRDNKLIAVANEYIKRTEGQAGIERYRSILEELSNVMVEGSYFLPSVVTISVANKIPAKSMAEDAVIAVANTTGGGVFSVAMEHKNFKHSAPIKHYTEQIKGIMTRFLTGSIRPDSTKVPSLDWAPIEKILAQVAQSHYLQVPVSLATSWASDLYNNRGKLEQLVLMWRKTVANPKHRKARLFVMSEFSPMIYFLPHDDPQLFRVCRNVGPSDQIEDSGKVVNLDTLIDAIYKATDKTAMILAAGSIRGSAAKGVALMHNLALLLPGLSAVRALSGVNEVYLWLYMPRWLLSALVAYRSGSTSSTDFEAAKTVSGYLSNLLPVVVAMEDQTRKVYQDQEFKLDIGIELVFDDKDKQVKRDLAQIEKEEAEFVESKLKRRRRIKLNRKAKYSDD